jgi:hypothetical protein
VPRFDDGLSGAMATSCTLGAKPRKVKRTRRCRAEALHAEGAVGRRRAGDEHIAGFVLTEIEARHGALLF